MEFISYLILAFAGISIAAGIFAWVFKIKESINNQETIIHLLGQLLVEHGLSQDEVNKIINPKKKRA